MPPAVIPPRSGQFGATALLALLGIIAAGALEARAADGAALAGELARLRSEVEGLAEQLDAEREAQRSRLRSLATRKADLEMELQREQMRLDQLRQARTRQRSRVEQTEQRKEALRPAVLAAIAAVRRAVRAGLPFEVHQRVAELDQLERQLAQGALTTPTALTRLWGKVEDELRLARENGLYRQVIPIGHEEVLAEVARVGMVLLYFRTRDGRIGRALQTADGWTFEVLHREDDQRRVLALFDAFKKRIRSGLFMLPVALPSGAQS